MLLFEEEEIYDDGDAAADDNTKAPRVADY